MKCWILVFHNRGWAGIGEGMHSSRGAACSEAAGCRTHSSCGAVCLGTAGCKMHSSRDAACSEVAGCRRQWSLGGQHGDEGEAAEGERLRSGNLGTFEVEVDRG